MKKIMTVAIGTIVGNGLMLVIAMLAYKPLTKWGLKMGTLMANEIENDETE